MLSVWTMDAPRGEEKKFGKHPTQKPLSLLKRIIAASTDKNDLVLDPFSGSSTTGIAAIRINRGFIGIELESEYIELSQKRLNQLSAQEKSPDLFENIPVVPKASVTKQNRLLFAENVEG